MFHLILLESSGHYDTTTNSLKKAPLWHTRGTRGTWITKASKHEDAPGNLHAAEESKAGARMAAAADTAVDTAAADPTASADPRIASAAVLAVGHQQGGLPQCFSASRPPSSAQWPRLFQQVPPG